MGLEDSHYAVLSTIYKHQNEIICRNIKGANSSLIDDKYLSELNYLSENRYIEPGNEIEDKTTPFMRAVNETDIRYYHFYTLTTKGQSALDNHYNSIELQKRAVLASEKSADSAERSVQASEISANAAVRSAKAAEDSAKSAHKSNRISFASLIVSAIAILCSIVIPIVTAILL